MGNLTARMVTSLTKKGRYADGDNLVLQVGPSGSKSWLFAYMRNGKSHQMGLGSAKLLSLAEARDKAYNLRRALKLDGIDPLAARRAAKARPPVPTFRDFAEEWIAVQEPTWKNPKHRQQWRNTLKTYVYPVIGDLPVDGVTTDQVLSILKPIWAAKAETARRVRTRIALILDAAKARDFRAGDNPAEWKGRIKPLLPSKRATKPQHHGSLPYREIPALMADLRKRPGMSSLALQFTILCASRTAETIRAVWSEIDLDAATWTMPAERTKQDREHIVPLPDAAVAILKSVPREADNEHVFPGHRRGRGLSDMSMLELLRGLRGRGVTTHGVARAGFRTWASEVGHPEDLAEAALGHVLGDKTQQAYNRGTQLERRRVMMKDWEAFLSRPTGGSVVAMKRKAKRS